MSRLSAFFTHPRTLAALGVLALLGLLLLASQLDGPAFWVTMALVILLAMWLGTRLMRHLEARRSAREIDRLVGEQSERAAAQDKTPANRAETEALRGRMQEAVKAIKQSKLGQSRGTAALYELPWYVIIGNPAAGKSSAILNSGLQFPFSDERGSVIQGIGGTRNCDWYFTTEGIVLDTAGRYSVSSEDRLEWLTFLDLLRKHRPMAPINGIVIAASIAELTSNKPEFAIELAKKLRQRVQELTERLEVFAPVYVVFTKADLIAGFTDFFHGLDPSEREGVWGATLPFEPHGTSDAVGRFDRHFDELSEGLKEMSLSQMALQRGKDIGPGLLTLPLEFSAIKPMLRIFVATLFEENPYQFKPVFRGFYFTSALQEGASVQSASERLARRFSLAPGQAVEAKAASSHNGYFLLNLFRKVVFADRKLVRQYNSKSRLRLRYASFFGAALALGLLLTGWTLSYQHNRQLTAAAEADLARAVAVQQDRQDLQARLQALETIQARLEQLVRYRRERPFGLGLGLYQGPAIEAKLRAEYFHGMQQLMLAAVGEGLESYLGQVVAHADQLRPQHGESTPSGPAASFTGPYVETSPTDVQDAYNALKTYLMLADPARVEVTHLRDQLTRFWRRWLEANRGQMPREDMIRSAERLLSFHIAQHAEPGWPRLDPRRTLVDETRQALRQVMRGASARDRVYADIKSRAATRFAPVTVASLVSDEQQSVITGSHAVPGTFTREAWERYVRDAFRDAASRELSSNDWVLETVVVDDLTLSGSPEHINKDLTDQYKREYAEEWRRFLQGVSVAGFAGFEEAVTRMNTLGDPVHSPLRQLLEAVHGQTAWDNPRIASEDVEAAKGGFMDWFRRSILRRGPAQVQVNVNLQQGQRAAPPAGPLGREFTGVARILAPHDGAPPLIEGYFEALGRVRTRLNAIRNQGDPGPGARQLMQQTLDGSGSDLSEALRIIDEQMLTGLDDAQRQLMRPLLLRPLVQTYAALIPVTEAELNRIWTAQVYEPFQRELADKYPFNSDARIEASSTDIARLFGPDSAIARYSSEALGPLVVRRGDTLTARQWADLGINLTPELVVDYARWVAPLGETGNQAGNGGRHVFQIRPLPAYGLSEYSIEIDGQLLRYRNTPAQWTNFVYPNPGGTPGTRVSAVTFDGRSVEIANFPGEHGLARLFGEANQQAREDGVYELRWQAQRTEVAVELRRISSPQLAADGSQRRGLHGLHLPAAVVGDQRRGGATGTEAAR